MYGARSYNLRSPANKRLSAAASFVQSSQPQVQPMAQAQQPFSPPPQSWPQHQAPAQPNVTPIPKIEPNDISNLSLTTDNGSDMTSFDGNQKKWTKKGFRMSLREKRRRQNKTLRRLITPKNALMVLNELSGGSQQECTVTPEGDSFTSNNVNRQYVAVLNMGGIEYSGKGSTKLMAKNMAAESVIRDMILKQMTITPPAENKPDAVIPLITDDVDMEKDDKSFPMIQLASYALHKLFSEWQTEGYKVPLFGPPAKEPSAPAPTTEVVQPSGKPKKTPILPSNPEMMHPCMLLSQMRGTLEYNLMSQEGAPPNRQIFTIAITIDGKSYAGQATNKKEARKQAAKKACSELYGVIYPDEAMVIDNQI